MPRDKSDTHARIVASMREEFLSRSYERASLNRISGKVGITTAALYKHFDGKQDMFASLVRPTLDALSSLREQGEQGAVSTWDDFDPFGEGWSRSLVDFIYDHFEGVKLLVCCSAGSGFESFEEDLIDAEAESNKRFAQHLARSGHAVQPLTDMQWHLLSTEYIHLVFETVRHDMTREQAHQHMGFVRALLYPGWREIFDL